MELKQSSLKTIGVVSEQTGIKPYILRYWEKEFPFLQPLKNKAGHRLYSPRDVFIIRNIKELLYNQGYSISGAKKVLLDVLLGRRSSSLRQYLDEIREDLHEILNVINNSLSEGSNRSQEKGSTEQ